MAPPYEELARRLAERRVGFALLDAEGRIQSSDPTAEAPGTGGLGSWPEMLERLRSQSAGLPVPEELESVSADSARFLEEAHRRVLDGTPLSQVLGSTCRWMLHDGVVSCAWIGLASKEGVPRIVAHAGTPAVSAPPDGDGRALGLLAVPLMARGRALGTLGVCAVVPDASDDFPSLVDRIEGFAGRVALFILHAQARERSRLSSVILESMDGAVSVSDQDGTVVWVNQGFSRLTGYDRPEVVGRTLDLIDVEPEACRSSELIHAALAAGETWRGRRRRRTKDGVIFYSSESITPVEDAGELAYAVTILQDTTDQKRHADALREMSRRDLLTNLPNRSVLEERIDGAVAGALDGVRGALILLDLDYFNLVNDALGHPAGDRILVSVSEILSGSLEERDLLARWGGDEFAILLDQADHASAGRLVDSLRRRVSEYRFGMSGQKFSLGFSAGVTLIDGRVDARTVLALADSALYKAKEQGAGRTVVFGSSDEGERSHMADTNRRLLLLKDALRYDGFTIHYQPIVEMADGKAVSWEALLRMPDEQGTLLMPDAFVPLAERYGLMPSVDRWVIAQALEELQVHPGRRIFVNISGSGLENEDHLMEIEHLLRANPIQPGQLVLEVTETAALQDFARAQRWMDRLGTVGCEFALDDFGTGFCTFSYLRRLPVQYVKIDKSFTRNLSAGPECRAMIQAILTVAEAMNKEVIAEGVESGETAIGLKCLGVPLGQGYFWGRPHHPSWAVRTGVLTVGAPCLPTP